MKKCKKCGAPLEGFFYNTLGKLLGIEPSKNDPEVCNKCAPKEGETVVDKGVESVNNDAEADQDAGLAPREPLTS